jgi:hypothetical protein
MRNQRQINLPAVIDEPAYVWAIGIYEGESPLKLAPAPHIKNPVLTYLDVTDAPAAFLADPFMLRTTDGWFMFFEVYNQKSGKGEIGLATSKDGRDWQYRQIVLKEHYHLSYPYVFAWQDEYYMIPETLEPKAIQLYRAVSFPDEWALAATLVKGEFADPSVFRFNDKWWLFACSTPLKHDTLRLYFADELTGTWTEHPGSPIIEGNERIARPAGRVLVFADKVIRFAQDCYPMYGTQVRAFEITDLTPTTYTEKECHESPIIKPQGSGWNEVGMHHLDPHLTSEGRWIACVDGMRSGVQATRNDGVKG